MKSQTKLEPWASEEGDRFGRYLESKITVAQTVKNISANAGDIRDMSSIPG